MDRKNRNSLDQAISKACQLLITLNVNQLADKKHKIIFSWNSPEVGQIQGKIGEKHLLILECRPNALPHTSFLIDMSYYLDKADFYETLDLDSFKQNWRKKLCCADGDKELFSIELIWQSSDFKLKGKYDSPCWRVPICLIEEIENDEEAWGDIYQFQIILDKDLTPLAIFRAGGRQWTVEN
ncbi:MAG: hypothetical protein ACFFCZ_03910 [Promethearchaeota archaeon]